MNKGRQDRTYTIRAKGLENAELRVEGNTEVPSDNLKVFGDSVGQFRAYVTLPPSSIKNVRTDIEFEIIDNETKLKAENETIFISGNE